MRLPHSIRILAAAAVLACGVAAGPGGCVHPRGPRVIESPDVNVKIPAIKKIARDQDRGAAPKLVTELESDDPAVRFYAIGALHRMTGQDFGYDYHEDDDEQRRPALDRWKQWLADEGLTGGGDGRAASGAKE